MWQWAVCPSQCPVHSITTPVLVHADGHGRDVLTAEQPHMVPPAWKSCINAPLSVSLMVAPVGVNAMQAGTCLATV